MSPARLEFESGYCRTDRRRFGAGDADDTNTAPAWGGRDCRDGIRVDQDFAAPASICLVMTYCCAMDNRLLTTQ